VKFKGQALPSEFCGKKFKGQVLPSGFPGRKFRGLRLPSEFQEPNRLRRALQPGLAEPTTLLVNR
jgi:hypothetical protein